MYPKQPIIIDTDPGVDDILAILLALASPEVDIKAITIGFGNTDVESSYLNIFKVWYTLERHLEAHPKHRERFPSFQSSPPLLAKGSSEPLEGPSVFAQYFHGRDGLSDISTRHPDLTPPPEWKTQYLQPTERSAVDITMEIIRDCPPQTITYVALGPLTNLAQILRHDGDCFAERIGRVIIMGGALDAPGNVTPVAEFNFYADPFAVHEVLTSKSLPLERVFILPLDLTGSHVLPFSEYKEHVDPAFENASNPSQIEGKTPLVHFTSSVLELTREIMLGFGIDGMELHDPVAMWCAISNPLVPNQDSLQHGWGVHKRMFQVERHGEITRGMLVTDKRENESNYEPNDNREQVHTLQESNLSPKRYSPEIVHQMLPKTIQGVNIVTRTPGNELLVEMIMQRIFCVKEPV